MDLCLILRKDKNPSSLAELCTLLESFTVSSRPMSHKRWMVCFTCWLLSITPSFLHALLMVFLESNVRWREREGDCLPSRGRLRVANHPIIWIKQVAPHWESSLKWRSILALCCLWKWKHISWLAYWKFSNKVGPGRREKGEAFPCWIIGCLDLSQSRFTCYLSCWIHGGLVVMMESGLRPWALSAEQSIPSVMGWSFLMQKLSFPQSHKLTVSAWWPFMVHESSNWTCE